MDLRIETYSFGADEYQTSLSLTRRFRPTVYDASYLALAAALDGMLVTADRKLAARAAPLKITETI